VHVHLPVGLRNIALLLTGEELAAEPAPGVRVGEEVEEVVLLLLLPLLLLPQFSVLLLEEEVLEAEPVPGVRGELEEEVVLLLLLFPLLLSLPELPPPPPPSPLSFPFGGLSGGLQPPSTTAF